MKVKSFWKQLKRDRQLVLMLAPVIIFFILFAYYPLYGVIIAFKDFSITKGIMGSPWVGFKYFKQFFTSPFFPRLMRNTVLISVYSLLWGFPIPILFALLINEVKSKNFKRVIQTISYLPHFISLVIVCSMVIDIFSSEGIINDIIFGFTGKRILFLGDPKWFRTVYVASGVWQTFGWNSIIYLAAITGINPDLYEASKIDGAGRLRQIWHVTLPGIKPTIVTLLILNIGKLMSVGYEKIILLYDSSTYETADVISTYVYRSGLLNSQYSYAGAVGLFNSAINIFILVLCNWVGKKFFDVRIW